MTVCYWDLLLVGDAPECLLGLNKPALPQTSVVNAFVWLGWLGVLRA